MRTRTYTGGVWRWVLPVAALAAVLFGYMASRNGTTTHVSAHQAPTTTHAAPPPGPHLKSMCGSLTGTPTVRHVVWIWMGSQSYGHLIGKSRIAPYTNQLAAQCGLATAYSAITHPAIANDVGVLAGDPHGLVHNACAPCTTSAPSLLSQVKSWRAFIGGMPSPCRKIDAGLRAYSRLNNPPTYLNVKGCQSFDLPLGTIRSGSLQRMLDRNAMPAFSLIAPDNCHDTGFDKHCTGEKKRAIYVARADVWLRGWIGKLTSSVAYRSGSMAIFVTWNQGTPAKALGEACTAPAAPSKDCHVPLLVISPYVPAGRHVTTRFSHYSLLKATETLLGIHQLLGNAADHRTGDLAKAFGL
jgi:phosphatidylinositol-3-phosphatase